MERKLQERMVGAGVLIFALVLIGPLVLDGGPADQREAAPAPGQRPEEIRTQTFRLGSTEMPQAAARVAPVVDSPAVPAGAGTAPAAAGELPVSAVVPEPEPEPKAEAQPAPKAEPKPAPAPETTAQARPEVPKASGDFLVQVGTFGQKDNADRLAASLKAKGYESFVSPLSRGGKTLYRVRVGPAGSRDAASRIASKLAAAGQDGQVVPR